IANDGPVCRANSVPPSPPAGRRERTEIGHQQKVAARFPHATMTMYAFPARGNRPTVKLTWYDGGLTPKPAEMVPTNSPRAAMRQRSNATPRKRVVNVPEANQFLAREPRAGRSL